MIIEEQLEVKNNLGLHARVAARIVQITNKYESEVNIMLNDLNVNAKSIMGVMLLAAVKGTVLTFRIEGDDAEELFKELKNDFNSNFGENE
jgi:phosphotransferase system HPr (HPr) family protein